MSWSFNPAVVFFIFPVVLFSQQREAAPVKAPSPPTIEESLQLHEAKNQAISLQSQANAIFANFLQTQQGRQWTEALDRMRAAEKKVDDLIKKTSDAHAAGSYDLISDKHTGQMSWKPKDGSK